MKVKHKIFGEGIIKNVEDVCYVVNFEKIGDKKIKKEYVTFMW